MRHYFAGVGVSSQSYNFSNSHSWMGKLDNKKSSIIKLCTSGKKEWGCWDWFITNIIYIWISLTTLSVIRLPLLTPGTSVFEMERTESWIHVGFEICSSYKTKWQSS